MNGKQAKVLHRMRATAYDKNLWKKLPAAVKGRLRVYVGSQPKLSTPSLEPALRAIGA